MQIDHVCVIVCCIIYSGILFFYIGFLVLMVIEKSAELYSILKSSSYNHCKSCFKDSHDFKSIFATLSTRKLFAYVKTQDTKSKILSFCAFTESQHTRSCVLIGSCHIGSSYMKRSNLLLTSACLWFQFQTLSLSSGSLYSQIRLAWWDEMGVRLIPSGTLKGKWKDMWAWYWEKERKTTSGNNSWLY